MEEEEEGEGQGQGTGEGGVGGGRENREDWALDLGLARGRGAHQYSECK